MSEVSSKNPSLSEESVGGEDSIAIVGMAGRFPGSSDLREFWRNLRDGVEGISFLSPEELAAAGVSTAELQHPAYVRAAPILEDIADFDAGFFGFGRPEAEITDPQHRLFMECAWEALEDAGCDPQRAPGQIGIFAGASLSTYLFFNLRETFTLSEGGFQSLIGNDKDYVASHTSYKLDLGGPSIGVQSACSTSLVATHLACQSLLSGECEVALAGGVTVKASQKVGYLHQEGGLFSPDGHCRPFDAQARGTIFGNGVGAVVLKRLDDALAAGDRVYAVIRGSAVNNDGARKVGYSAPGEDGQVRVISEALNVAEVDPGSIAYVETHGTGTSLGDPIEVAALKKVFGEVPSGDRCALGAVKSNVGHLESAAGIVGLIKTVLALHHGELPPSLNFEQPNPQIDFEDSPFYVNTELRSWPDFGTPRRAGVSSFGIGGTNAHLVLEEAPPVAGRGGARDTTPLAAQILPLSARSSEALHELAAAYRERLQAAEDPQGRMDLAANAAQRRSHHDHRLALVLAPGDADPAAPLDALIAADGKTPTVSSRLAHGRRHPERRPQVVFVFPGQGSQWQGMGCQLMAEEPVFRDVIDDCARAIQRHAGWSLHEVLTAAPESSRLGELDVVQPTIFAIQVALARLWQAWGIEPAAVIGHSLGEVAAACIAGALSLDDAARVICRRSHLALEARGRGGMMLVELPHADALAALAGHEERLAIAACNSPRATVLSGDDAALDALEQQLGEKQIFCRRIQVDFASHSPQVDPLLPRLVKILDGLSPQPARLPIYSTVGSAQLTDGAGFDATYWRDNLRQPVMLADAVNLARQDGHYIFLEISPHPVLVPSLSDCVREAVISTDRDTHAAEPAMEERVLSSLRRQEDERTMLLETLAVLYADGCPVDWSAVAPVGRPFVELPTYPWQRQSYWIEADQDGTAGLAMPVTGSDGQGLLGAPVRSSLDPDTRIWQIEVSTRRFAYLAEHKVQGAVVTSAAFYLELVFAAARQALATEHPVLERVRLHQAMFLPPGHRELLQLVLAPEGPAQLTFRIASRPLDESTAGDAAWTLRADGLVLRPSTAEDDSAPDLLNLEATAKRLGEATGREDFFDQRREQGFDYGPAYQGLEAIQRGDGEALARLHLPAPLAAEAERYHMHPALLDVALQVVAAAAPETSDDAIYLEVGFDRVQLHGSPRGELWAHAVLAPEESAGDSRLKLYDDAGQLLLEVSGFEAQRIEDVSATEERLDDQLFEVRWQHQPLAAPTASEARRWLLLADRGEIATHLEEALIARGDHCLKAFAGERFQRNPDGTFTLSPTAPEEAQRLWQEVLAEGPLAGVIYLWGLDAGLDAEAVDRTFDGANELTSDGLLHLLQAAGQTAAAPRLVVISRGVHPLPDDPADGAATLPAAVVQAPLWGLGAVVANEHPELHCLNVDLSPGAADPREITQLLAALDSSGEQRLAIRGEHCYSARLEQLMAAEPAVDASESTTLRPAEDRPYHLSIAQPGDLGTLALRAQPPLPELAAHEVLIEVRAAGVGFRDVLTALALYPDQDNAALQLGSECAGVIVACGSEVDASLAPGTAVIAPVLNGFGRYALASAAFTVSKPETLSFEQAGGLAIPYMTAYYALVELARLQPGERVLIHSAASGTGLAALHLAQHLGAEVFATAGNPEKRAMLRSSGVAQVMDSRRLDFAREVLAATDGAGVDVVLNALTGEAMTASLELLAPYGRFLELGLRDIYQNRSVGLRAFRENVSYFAIDQARMMSERQDVVARLLRRVVALFAEGHLAPPPVTAFPLSHAAEAFDHMAKARHMGRVVLTPDPEPDKVLVAPPSAAEGWAAGEADGRSLPVRGDGSYLVTGGLGGLGLTFARWLVAEGAGGLVLLGRRGASGEVAAQLEQLRSAGANVRALSVDVADTEALRQALASIEDMPPLRGVLHAAGVLADGTLENQSAETFRQVLRPKVAGAWNLHRLTEGIPLDFFVLFSSTVTLFGNLGQSNYAAANFALDVLARQRRAAGLPGLSINWGAFSEVGMWAADDAEAVRQQEERLAFGGMSSLRPADGTRALTRLLRHQLGQQAVAQVAVMPFSMASWQIADPRGSSAPLFARLAADASPVDGDQGGGALRGELLAAPDEERNLLLEAFLIEQVAAVLRTEVGSESLDAPLASLGLDSLMALGLRNRIEHELGLPIPIVQFLQSPSLRQFGTDLLQRMVLEQVLISTAETAAAETGADDDDEWEVVTI